MTATKMCSNSGGFRCRPQRSWALSLDQKTLKAGNTSFEEDLNRLDMLSLMSLIKGLPTLS